MALITSHTLNGTDGTHADGIAVNLIISNKPQTPLIQTHTDEGGRLYIEIEPERINSEFFYDLVFKTEPYWARRNDLVHVQKVNEEIVIRFRMPNPEGNYHMPIILNPNSYSIWTSGE